MLFFGKVQHGLPSHYSGLPMRIGHPWLWLILAVAAPTRSAWERALKALVALYLVRGCLIAGLSVGVFMSETVWTTYMLAASYVIGLPPKPS